MNAQMQGVWLSLGLLRRGGHQEAADYLQRLLTEPADDETLEALQRLTEEATCMDEIAGLP